MVIKQEPVNIGHTGASKTSSIMDSLQAINVELGKEDMQLLEKEEEPD